jgi:radical SAM superfamily enzyme YgiQ (UPF0313 family)
MLQPEMSTAGRILLISINRCVSPYPVFPLGLAHLQTALRQAGYETRWFDFNTAKEPPAVMVDQFQPDFIGLSLRNIDDVIITARETFFGPLVDLCLELRQMTRVPIILGGSGFSIFPKELLERCGADFGIQGEGEASLISLLRALQSAGDYAKIPGLVFRQGDRIVINSQRADFAPEEIRAWDRPGPLAEFYLQTSSMLNLQTQRGCALDCCYCTYPLIEGRQYRRRPPESVAEEMERLEHGGARYVFLVDSVFNSSPGHVTGICEALLRRKINLKWGCFLRPKNLSPELMRLMARAGLAHIEFGSDSFCDEVLRSYGKHFTFEDILHSSELAREEKVDFCHFLICGGPGETRETLRTSFENSRRLRDAVILALVGMRIYPRTPLFEQAVREGRIPLDADLLQPHYYLSEEFSEDEIFLSLREFSRICPGWIVGDPDPEYLKLAERLRARGVVGPLWSYFAAMLRLRGLKESPFAQKGSSQ